MIELNREEDIEIWGIQADLRIRGKDHPFVALLMAALEMENEQLRITAREIQERLLRSIPVIGVQNLLSRFCLLGYLEKIEREELLHYEDLELGKDLFRVLEFGRESARKQVCWSSETGLFELSLVDSPFIPQKVVAFSKVPPKDNGAREEKLRVPEEIKALEKKEMELKQGGYFFEKMLHICYHKPDESKALQLKASPNEIKVILKGSDYEGDLGSWNESSLQDYLLMRCTDLDYDSTRGSVFIPFDPENLLFNRDVKVSRVVFMDKRFEPVTLRNIKFVPATQEDADNWYTSILEKRINRYFSSEEEFLSFQRIIQDEFHDDSTFEVEAFSRIDFLNQLSSEPKHFYLRAKFESIYYLNY